MGLTYVYSATVVLVSYFLLKYISDPLRGIPGPFLASLTRWWLLFIELKGYRTTIIHQLHQKYGPVVRIGPHELSFSSQQAIHDIYGPRAKYPKADAYRAFGRKSLFTMRTKEEHRARARRIAHVFTPVSVAQVEPVIHEQVVKMLGVLEKRVDEPIDMLRWFRMFALEVIGRVFLSKSFGGLDTEETPQIMHDIDEVQPSYWIEYEFPLLRKILMHLPIRSLQKQVWAGENFYRYGAQAFNDYVAEHGRTGQNRDLLQKMIAGGGDKNSEPLPDEDIITEITNLTFAGIDTTGNTFAYLFWKLARHPLWQERLRTELASVQFSAAGIAKYSDVKDLPILEALIQETLRFHPSSPASLPRGVPAEGGTIDGTPVPAGIVVSAQCYTTQRDPIIFDRPDEFLPQRWIDAASRGDESLEAMQAMILVWGRGTRACLGKQVALMELKLNTSAIVRRYRVELGSETTDTDMEMMDHFVIIPKGGRTILRFREI